MIRLKSASRKAKLWKLALSSEADDEDTHECILVELRRGKVSYTIDMMRYDDGKGDPVDIADIGLGSPEAVQTKKIYEAFKIKWVLYASELRLPFHVDSHIEDWSDELFTNA